MKARLIAAFEESLRDAPDQEEVLTGLRIGIERHRQRHRRQRVAVAMSAVAVILVVSMVTVFSIRHKAAPVAPDGPTPTIVPTPSPDIPVRSGNWPSTIYLGWVPDGMKVGEVIHSISSEYRAYSSVDKYLNVTVDKVDPLRDLNQTGWQHTEIHGRPSRWAARPDQAVVSFPLSSGRWVTVHIGLTDSSRQSTQLRDDAERVANSIVEHQGLTLKVDFEARYLPPGHQVIGRENVPSHPVGFGSLLTSAGSLQPGNIGHRQVMEGLYDDYRVMDTGVGLIISMLPSNSSLTTGHNPVAEVQGRPAYQDPNERNLIVPDFHGGASLVVVATVNGTPASVIGGAPGPEPIPLAELIKVAQGVTWHG